MMRKVFAIALGVLILGGVGLFVYGNFFIKDPSAPIEYKMPTAEEAPYELTGQKMLVLTASYEKFGDSPGERIYVCHGYWELVGIDFKYRDHDGMFSEQTYGTITVRRR